MLMIGFLIIAFLILNASQLTFLSMGHTGSAYARNSGPPAQVIEDEYEEVHTTEQSVIDAKMTREKWEMENDLAVIPLPFDTEDSAPSESKSTDV